MRLENDGTPRWRFAMGSAVGTSHTATNLPCQDSYVCEVLADPEGDEVLVAIAADGAGSARLSQIGSATACTSLLESIRTHLLSGERVGGLDRGKIISIANEARARIAALACEASEPIREFACTLVGAVVATDLAAFFQIGDGAMVVAPRNEPDTFSWIFWPERGEYANTTVFLSDERFADHLMHDLVAGAIDEVAVLTDGIQPLVLDYKARVAHFGFFNPMFGPFRTREGNGEFTDLSAAITKYLDSPRVNERTDDDKTLILASRRTMK